MRPSGRAGHADWRPAKKSVRLKGSARRALAPDNRADRAPICPAFINLAVSYGRTMVGDPKCSLADSAWCAGPLTWGGVGWRAGVILIVVSKFSTPSSLQTCHALVLYSIGKNTKICCANAACYSGKNSTALQICCTADHAGIKKACIALYLTKIDS